MGAVRCWQPKECSMHNASGPLALKQSEREQSLSVAELAAATCAPLGWHRAATDRPAGGRGFSALPEASPLGAFVSSAHLARADEASTGELAAAGRRRRCQRERASGAKPRP
ncbi:hypothetical protein Rsub_08264 [Raphidocelis subcapitata]|uniref:Uncharacterized protein n=1 Tax=Raphidocelis subcapitata TaxID=307507 RepID=A0A2V0P7I5_9CHLO|nr:hypothetical protein Rsub_08264 [Raphidocelis subcapitata]|eukprot:GBF95828.1 hypothetical protein Rsub_08264 [Raphidocelis subcapitata]